MRTTLGWLALALLGLAIAAGVSLAASSLVSQRIGLSSQPVDAGQSLAPAAAREALPGEHRHGRARTPGNRTGSRTSTSPTRPATTTTTPTVTPPTTAPATTSPPATRPAGEGDGGGGGGGGGPDD